MVQKSKKKYEPNNLKRNRKNNNLTQKALAEKSGVKLCTIKSYEQGRVLIDNAPAINVFRLAKALGIEMETLLQLPNEDDSKKRYYKR